MQQFWVFRSNSKGYIYLIPHSLEYFNSRFIGNSMTDGWVPPPVTISSKTNKIPDFLSWLPKAPVVSERVKILMENLDGINVEFLPFIKIRKTDYFAVNVLQKEDYLDFDRSVVTAAIQIYIARDHLPKKLPPMFKCKGVNGDVFVSRGFGDMVVEHKLTGAALADPEIPTLDLIVAGKSMNCFPGVIESYKKRRWSPANKTAPTLPAGAGNG